MVRGRLRVRVRFQKVQGCTVSGESACLSAETTSNESERTCLQLVQCIVYFSRTSTSIMNIPTKQQLGHGVHCHPSVCPSHSVWGTT
jgi:hypothetical protein